MSRTIIASRAYGKYVIDGVHLDIHNEEGLIKSCIQGRNLGILLYTIIYKLLLNNILYLNYMCVYVCLGFDGKSLIHPGQIATCNRYFSPSADEVAHARRVVSAYEGADGDGMSCVYTHMLYNMLYVIYTFRLSYPTLLYCIAELLRHR